ncbi:MAG: hypothetical protein HC906_12770 [Bacteroidales bacterium]|nr:hypothetical protein [Bacteroidales bacterium]
MWAQILNTFLGLWLMISPNVLKFNNSIAADFNYITGPLIVTFAVISYWEASRNVRRWNIPIALFLIIASFTFDSNTARLNDILTCIPVVVFSLVKGKITQKFGGGWKSLFQENPEHMQGT